MIVAVAAGLGGGYLAASIANPPAGMSKLERRMSSEPISVAAATAQPSQRAAASACEEGADIAAANLGGLLAEMAREGATTERPGDEASKAA